MRVTSCGSYSGCWPMRWTHLLFWSRHPGRHAQDRTQRGGGSLDEVGTKAEQAGANWDTYEEDF